ncbi:uncharacterized protein LOC143540193 [Bidens hawaiensis]|uniref:uncharacterized protein LOC143540193 n=1 Tax=Bidens hawaiensis TaxID=980011 RepID=UPI004049A9D0
MCKSCKLNATIDLAEMIINWSEVVFVCNFQTCSSCCVTDYYTGAGDDRPLFPMEIELKKEESSETSIFIDFSIREYVAEIRKKDPEKCWPFGSLPAPDNKVASLYQSPESTLLSGQNWPSNINSSDDTTELTDAPNYLTESLEIDSDKGKAVYNGSSALTFCKVNGGQTQHEINNVDEDAKIGHNEAADNIEPGGSRSRRKHKKFRLLSDIYKDPASKLQARYDRTKTEKVNRRFVAEIEDELDDDVTLAAYFKKQKGVEITDSTLNKKRRLTAVEAPSVDQDKKSNHGSVDSVVKDLNAGTSRKKSRSNDVKSQIIQEHKKDIRLQCNQTSNQLAEVSGKKTTETEKENEDPEMEAVMLLARHFNDQKQILNTLETHPRCACVKKKIREHTTQSGNKSITKTSSNTATKHRVKKTANKKLENASVTKTSSKTATKHRAKKITKKKLENAFSSAQMSMMKAAAAGPDAENCATFVCSINRNPADFSIPNDENAFMRGG